MNKRRPRRVSATDLASLARCERQAMYRFHHRPERVDSGLTAARRRGEAEHARRHREVITAGGVGVKHRRGPCFIASAVYGRDAWQTNRLRKFRDEKLLPRWWGRLAVAAYYRFSPRIASALATRPRAARLVRAGLDRFVHHT